MAMGKRQLVLAALVVALGAAVYLNVVISGNNAPLKATQAVASNTGRQYGQTLAVNGSAVSGSSAKGKASSASKTGSTAKATVASASDDYFNQVQLNRQKTQDEAKETFEKVLTDTTKDTAAHKEAVDKAAALTEKMVKQANIETLIKAKGYSNCIVTLGDNQCSVVVKTKKSDQSDAVVIQDIVAGQTGLSFDKIQIIERT